MLLTHIILTCQTILKKPWNQSRATFLFYQKFSLKKNYLLVKYENLINNPKDEFKKIADFISNLIRHNFNKSEIDTAIELSSFEKLEKMEKDHGFVESSINKEGKKNKFFYLGPKNDWKKILNKNVSDEISEKFQEEMRELNYLQN